MANGNYPHSNSFLNRVISIRNAICPGVLNKGDILSQRLKFNKFILIGNTPISKNLFGLTLIADLYDQETNTFKNFNTLKNDYNIDILTYNQLISAIKKDWKIILKGGRTEKYFRIPYLRSPTIIPLEKWTSQIIYRQLLNTCTETPLAFSKWTSQDLPVLIKQNYNLTSNTKLLDTQFRITNRFYHTRAQLRKWGIDPDGECVSCRQEDDLLHHFILCERVAGFWKTIKNGRKV